MFPTAFGSIPTACLLVPAHPRSERLARGAPLPHILIHGAPGVGKTLLSRKLGRMCGLRSAIVSGGDVGSFGQSASAEMNRLMKWAGATQSLSWKRGYRRGRRTPGVMLVLDEAEAVAGDRRFVKYCESAFLHIFLFGRGDVESRPDAWRVRWWLGSTVTHPAPSIQPEHSILAWSKHS